jgi:hypothetical protein
LSPLTAANASFALNAGEWVRRVRLAIVGPGPRHPLRFQAEIPLIDVSEFGRLPLSRGRDTGREIVDAEDSNNA